ncbi:hypothetical protein E5288_WYG009597 [Bos mutus]|uniref:D-aminoacyl-tRNA deacylase n=1 Tax=Bos mutus TaxID=72004 RepID=A0A6B0QX66_9CETA|nr:hypothetical protein [Bos mutus]
MQYHCNSGKEEGLELYSQFVNLCKKELAANSKCAEAGVVVKHDFHILNKRICIYYSSNTMKM